MEIVYFIFVGFRGRGRTRFVDQLVVFVFTGRAKELGGSRWKSIEFYKRFELV